jgi:protein phosphatase
MLDDSGNRLWCVADGMGGHSAGDVASRAIVEKLRTVQRPPSTADYVDRVDDAIAEVNADLIKYARDRHLQLVGSTAVVLLAADKFMLYAWSGDSRIYQWAGGSLRRLTADHTQGQQMLSTGQFSAAEIQRAPDAGALVRAVGAEPDLVVEWGACDTGPNDVFLLCSDGVTKELSDHEIGEMLSRSATATEISDAIIETCLERGARDNVTALVVRVDA